VRRSRYADDKRSFVIEPTAAGRTVRSQLEEVWKELEDAAVGGVSEDERRTILRVLEELEESLTQAAAELRV
jgi:DNA-binding MarR family transcriptional regulator